jgi:hypothetical protein
VTGKKPEEYPTETIEPTKEVKPTEKVTPENIESIYKDKKIKIKIQDAKTYEGGYEQKEEYKTYDANTLKKTGDNEYTIGEEKTGRLNLKINENGELETLPTFGVEGNRPIEVIEEKPTTKTNIKKRKKIVKDIGVKLKSINESKIQPIPEGYFDTPEKQDLLNKFKNETITDAEIDNAMELFTDDEFIYIDKNFMQYPPEIEEALAQIVPEMMAKKYKDIPRGADEIKSTIENGVKKGKINEDSAKIASVLLDKRPDLFNELGLLLSPDEESFGSLGSYDPINKTIEIFKTNEDATTIGHELLHHTEKFLPKDIKIAIREEWLSAINKEVNSLNNNIKKENLNETDLKRAKKALEYLKEVKENDEMYQNIDTLDVNKYLNQRDGLYHYFRGEDGLTRKYYNMFDASEWWANHGAEMLKDYALVKDKKAFIEKIKDFYKELIQAIKEFVSPTKAREVENALNNLFKGAYEKFEGSNIASSRFETIKKSVEEPKYSQTEEGKKVDEDAKKMGFDNVTHAINSVNEALGTDYKTFQEIKPKELQEAIDIRDHNKAFEEIIKGTEYEKQAGDIKSSGEATTGTTGEVSGKPEAKEQYTHTDAGFRDESDARTAYEQRGDKDVSQTYEEFLFSKACGDF